MDRNLVREALTRSKLQDGVLSVEGMAQEEIRQLNEGLRNALLACEIPHYKVIGVSVVAGGNTSIVDYVTKLESVNKSYTELLNAFEYLIYSKAGGSLRNTLHKFPSGWGYLMSVDHHVTSSNHSLFYTGKGMDCIAEPLVNGIEVIHLQRPIVFCASS